MTFSPLDSNNPSNPETIQWPTVSWPWKRLSREFKLAFAIACIMGLVVHQYALNNLLLGNDSQNHMYSTNDYIFNGRWALGFFASLRTYYQSSVIIGLISIFMIALAAGLTVRILELTHPVSIAAVSALLITYPVIPVTFAYMFTADAYFIALFFNALAVYLTKRFRLGFLAGILLICTACGAYQAYIGYAAGLFLFDCMLDLFRGEGIPQTVRKGLKYIAVLLFGLVFYMVGANLLLRLHGYVLPSYQGMDALSHPDPLAILRAVPNAYRIFLNYIFQQWPHFSRLSKWAQFAAPVLCSVFGLYLIAAKQIYREPARLLLLAAGACLIPLALNLVAVLAYGASIHSLMIYAYVLLFTFLIKLAELAARQLLRSDSKRWKLPALTAIVCCFLVIWNNFCATNVCYHALQTRYEVNYAVANRAIARIEVLDGYISGETPVCLMGVPYAPYSSSEKYPDGDIFWRVSFPFMSPNFLNWYLGFPCKNPSSDQVELISNSEAFAAMPVFPADGSISMIDGIAVAKFS